MILTRVFNKAHTPPPCCSMLPPARSSLLLAAALPFAWLTTALGPARAGAPPPSGGPTIELAPEHQEPSKKAPMVSLGAGAAPDHELVRGLTEQRFRSAAESL